METSAAQEKKTSIEFLYINICKEFVSRPVSLQLSWQTTGVFHPITASMLDCLCTESWAERPAGSLSGSTQESAETLPAAATEVHSSHFNWAERLKPAEAVCRVLKGAEAATACNYNGFGKSWKKAHISMFDLRKKSTKCLKPLPVAHGGHHGNQTPVSVTSWLQK